MPASKHDQEVAQWEPKRRLEYERTRIRVLVTARIENLLEGMGLKQSDLAKRISKSSAWVSKLLSGNQNVTLDTVAEVGWALGVRWDIQACPTNRENTPASADGPLPDWVHRQSRIVVRHAAASNYSLVPIDVSGDVSDIGYYHPTHGVAAHQAVFSRPSSGKSAVVMSALRFTAGEQFDLGSSCVLWTNAGTSVGAWTLGSSSRSQPDVGMSQGEMSAASTEIEVSP
jgi:transcriptional regulator with XRE-family HTH domain